MPRFGEPVQTRPAHEVLAEAGAALRELRALTPFSEPALPVVVDPVDEPLVAVDHPRIALLHSYQEAGWSRARPDCRLREGAFERLVAVADSLPDRWGLAVFDAWRPLDLQAELYHAAYDDPGLPPGFVSEPDGDPATPPPHLTGGAVDLTLTLDGHAIAPGAGFDDFTDRAAFDALEDVAGSDRELRRMLYWAMQAAGFVVLDCEWWHFEHGTRRWAAITGNSPRYGPTA